jgi:ParB family chromosome partitioning protein
MMEIYVDPHRHAAVRGAMVARSGIALRLMVAHAITGPPLWTVRGRRRRRTCGPNRSRP